MTRLSQIILPTLMLAFLAGACINSQSDNTEVLKKLDVLSQKLDSLKQSNTEVAATDDSNFVNHAPGHIIDPPIGFLATKPGVMAKIEVDADIPYTNLKKGDIIYGIDSRNIKPKKHDEIFFRVALDPKTNTYYAYDLCKVCH